MSGVGLSLTSTSKREKILPTKKNALPNNKSNKTGNSNAAVQKVPQSCQRSLTFLRTGVAIIVTHPLSYADVDNIGHHLKRTNVAIAQNEEKSILLMRLATCLPFSLTFVHSLL